jgi:hypothetical protein
MYLATSDPSAGCCPVTCLCVRNGYPGLWKATRDAKKYVNKVRFRVSASLAGSRAEPLAQNNALRRLDRPNRPDGRQ